MEPRENVGADNGMCICCGKRPYDDASSKLCTCCIEDLYAPLEPTEYPEFY